jgi:hypothetical protein
MIPRLLALLPLAFLMLMYAFFAPDYPFKDQWELPLLLEKMHTDGLGLSDFWAQHNEHRLLFPRLVMLFLARLSHWNVLWEQAVNLLLGMGIFAFWVLQARRSLERKPLGWLLPLLSLLAFSLAQWGNWFLGWQLQEFMNVLALCAACYWLATPNWPHCLAAALAGIVATYSFANGLLVWPLGLAILLYAENQPRWKMTPKRAFWTVIGVLVITSYLYGYQRPPHHPPFWSFIKHPVDFVLYFFKYLGQPVCNFSGITSVGAAMFGVVGLSHWLSMFLPLLRGSKKYLASRWAPLAALGAYAVLSALLTGAARIEMGGSDQAMSPRYVTMANLFWFSLLIMAWMHFSPTEKPKPGRVACVVVAVCIGLSSLWGAYKWTERYNAYAPARQALVEGSNDEVLKRLYPDVETLLERREILKRYRYSLFSKTPPTE